MSKHLSVGIGGILLMCVGCQTVSGTGRMQVDHSSPRSLLTAYHAAIRDRDYGAILSCTLPSLRRDVDPMLYGQREYDRKSKVMQKLVAPFGVPKADAFLRDSDEVHYLYFTRILRWDLELTDPNVVKYTVIGDEVEITEPAAVGGRLMKKQDNRWYISATNPGDVAFYRRVLAGTTDTFNHAISRIEAGKANKTNLLQLISKSRAARSSWSVEQFEPAN